MNQKTIKTFFSLLPLIFLSFLLLFQNQPPKPATLTSAIAGNGAATGALSTATAEISRPLTKNKDKSTQQIASTVIGAVTGGLAGANTALEAENNNRQLHQKEIAWIEKNAKSFAKELYGANPTPEQIADAKARLAQEALRGVDNSWAKVFGSKTDTKAKEFLDKNNANLFKATEEEKKERYINYQTLTQYYDFYKNTSPELFNEMLKGNSGDKISQLSNSKYGKGAINTVLYAQIANAIKNNELDKIKGINNKTFEQKLNYDDSYLQTILDGLETIATNQILKKYNIKSIEDFNNLPLEDRYKIKQELDEKKREIYTSRNIVSKYTSGKGPNANEAFDFFGTGSQASKSLMYSNSQISDKGEKSPLKYYVDKKIKINNDGSYSFKPMSNYTVDFGNPISAILNINERAWDAGTNSVEQIVGSAKTDIIPFSANGKDYILRTTVNTMGVESETAHIFKDIPNISKVKGQRTPRSNVGQNFYSIEEIRKTKDGIKLVPIDKNIDSIDIKIKGRK